MLVEVSVMDFTEIPRNPGETECVPGSFFLHPHTRAGNKAVTSLSGRDCIVHMLTTVPECLSKL